MKHIKLIISSILAFLGILIYFISIPKVNHESLATVTVEAGNEDLLEDLYFNGYLYDYSSFHLNKEGIEVMEDLPYLEKLDVPGSQTMRIIQQSYPEFVDPLVYDRSIYDFYVLNSKDYLLSGHFEVSEENYMTNHSTVYFKALNKATNELIEDKVTRNNAKEGDSVSVIGMYEEYPVIKVLYHTDIWSQGTNQDTSILTAAEYNFETKNYTEVTVENMEGDFSSYNQNLYGADNNQIEMINHVSFENGDSNSNQYYLYNYTDNSFTLLEADKKHYFIQNNQIYSLAEEEQGVILSTHNQKGDEVLQETTLNIKRPIDTKMDYPFLNTEVIDNKLYVVQSQAADGTPKLLPTSIQVFDIETGEQLLVGEITFNAAQEINAYEVIVDEVGQMSDLAF